MANLSYFNNLTLTTMWTLIAQSWGKWLASDDERFKADAFDKYRTYKDKGGKKTLAPLQKMYNTLLASRAKQPPQLPFFP